MSNMYRCTEGCYIFSLTYLLDFLLNKLIPIMLQIILVAHNDDPTDQMFVFFPEEPKIGIRTIR